MCFLSSGILRSYCLKLKYQRFEIKSIKLTVPGLDGTCPRLLKKLR